MTKADVDNVLSAGWNEEAIKDAIAVCCLFNLINRLADAYSLQQPSPEKLTEMANQINRQGYQAAFRFQFG